MHSFGKLCEDSSTRFVLKGINPSQLDREYILVDLEETSLQHLSDNLSDTNDPLLKVTTSLEYIGMSKPKSKPFETIWINDDKFIRIFVAPNVFQKQSSSNTTTTTSVNIANYKKSNCWFCRNQIPYEWHPIGIPIKYKHPDTFEVEGIFCSFNCIVAYINEHFDYRYKDSSVLLLMFYRKLMKTCSKLTQILPSPSWKLLKEYGGHLSIDEYRKSLQCLDYKTTQQIFSKGDVKVINGSEIFVEV
jgi:hypothetical protein